MNRNIRKQTLVLSVRANAQDNRTVCLLTKDGIEYSTLYGGPKSKLRGTVSPWNFGTMYFYSDATKNTSKISDFDVQKYHPTFRENLFKSFAAALAGEIAVKSKCAGSPEMTFSLVNGFLDGMDLCGERAARLGLIRFLWRYMDLLGVRPDTQVCAGCGEKFAGKDSESVIQYEPGGRNYALYSGSGGGFFCADCVLPQEKGARLSYNSLYYLSLAGGEDYGTARSLKLTALEYNELKVFVFQSMEEALGFKLKTFISGRGIL